MDEVLSPELQEKYFDRLIRGRGRSVSGLRSEWDSLRHIGANEILKAYDTDGGAKSDAAPAQPSTSTSPAKPGVVERFNEGVNCLDMDKFRGIGAATQGFDPKAFLNAPPVGSTSTSTDNSVKHQTFKGGDTHVAIHTHGDVRETAELWKRHGERQKADDLRYAASVFA